MFEGALAQLAALHLGNLPDGPFVKSIGFGSQPVVAKSGKDKFGIIHIVKVSINNHGDFN